MVELQEREGTLEAMNARVLAVFREEGDGLAGLKKVRSRLEADFILALDTPAEQTRSYGVGPPDFHTYIIDPDGTIRAILSGGTYSRPTGKEIVDRLKEIQPAS